MDAKDVIMVIENDARSHSEVRALARHVIGQMGWTPNQAHDVEPYKYKVAEAIGEAVWDYILSWIGPKPPIAGADDLGSLILKQLGSSIAWDEVGRHYIDDYAENLGS
jgi:hypothetical protein